MRLERIFWLAIIFIIVNVTWYFAKPIVAPMRYATLAQSCGIKEKIKNINSKNVDAQEKRKINKEFWLCVKNQQGMLERFFIGVPQSLLDQ